MTGDLINAFSILDIVLRPGATKAMICRGANLLLVADLQRRGERSWRRVAVVDRLSRTIAPTSAYVPGRPEQLAAGPLPPLFINDAVLRVNPFLRVGDEVVWLAFNDVSSESTYQKDLRDAETAGRSLMPINLQELPLATTGGIPESYQARDADRLRIRLLGASYTPTRAQEVRVLLGMSRLERNALDALWSEAAKIEDRHLRDEKVVHRCLDSLKASQEGTGTKLADSARAAYDSLDYHERRLVHHLLNDRRDPAMVRFADIVTHEDEVTLEVREFGFKFDISPVIAYGRLIGAKGSVDGFNPIKTTPSIGSNIYPVYDGRNDWKHLVNLLPGVHMSLLGLGGGQDAHFTLGVVHPIVPKWRHYIGLFLAWHELRARVWGFTFSPDINFRALVSPEKK